MNHSTNSNVIIGSKLTLATLTAIMPPVLRSLMAQFQRRWNSRVSPHSHRMDLR